MSDHVTRSCDGCAMAAFALPLEGRDITRQLDRQARDRNWVTPLTGVWLCPACAAITEIRPEPETEAMF